MLGYAAEIAKLKKLIPIVNVVPPSSESTTPQQYAELARSMREVALQKLQDTFTRAGMRVDAISSNPRDEKVFTLFTKQLYKGYVELEKQYQSKKWQRCRNGFIAEQLGNPPEETDLFADTYAEEKTSRQMQEARARWQRAERFCKSLMELNTLVSAFEEIRSINTAPVCNQTPSR